METLAIAITRAATRGGGAESPEKISPPCKKMIIIIHGTGIGNLPPPLKYFSPPKHLLLVANLAISCDVIAQLKLFTKKIIYTGEE